MNYRVLGPLEVDVGAGPLPLSGKPGALLALLLLNANETLSPDRIAEDLACDTLDEVVATLRQVLPEGVLETHWGGYRLRVPDGALDLQRFEALVREANLAEPDDAARLLEEALALWRGPPLAGIGEPFARDAAARLEERRFMVSLYRAPNLRRALASTRLLTLTGPGGIGKTQLARELACDHGGDVHFVALEAITDPELVTTTILLALGVRQERQPLDVLVAELRDSRTLLVLDHFDHVREAAVEMAVLLRRTPGLTLLVTSREALGVADEREWPVAGAPLPVEPMYARLSRSEQRAFEQLAVFVGGAPVDAALVESGLVRNDGTMEPIVREFAIARLADADAAHEALAAHVCELAREGGAGVRGPDEPAWSARLDRELPNLRAAFAWMLARGRHAGVLGALIDLTPFFWRFGHTREGARWFAAALDAPGLDADLRRRGQAMAANLLWNVDGAEAERLARAALATPAEPDDPFTAAAHGVIALVTEQRGDIERALMLAHEVEATFRRRREDWNALLASLSVSRLLAAAGRGDPIRIARNLIEARLNGRYLLAVALVEAGLLALRAGEPRTARATLMEAVVVTDQIGNPIARARALSALAMVELAEGDPARAATLLGAAHAIRASLGSELPAAEKELARSLDPEFTQAWRRGQTLSSRAAVAFALD